MRPSMVVAYQLLQLISVRNVAQAALIDYRSFVMNIESMISGVRYIVCLSRQKSAVNWNSGCVQHP